MKRSLARLPLLVALLCIVAASSVLLQALPAMVTGSARDLVESRVSAAPPREVSARVETGAGDTQTRAALTAFLRTYLGGLPLELHVGIDAGTVETDAGDLTVESDPELREHAALVDGRWAESDGEAVLQARAAAAAGVGVGDVVRLDDALEVLVVGTWQPTDARAPLWFGEPGPASGSVVGAAGPLMVSEQVIDRIAAQSSARWVISADEPHPSDLAAVQRAAAGLAEALDRSGLTVRSVVVEGDLEATMAQLRSTLDSSARLAAVPLALLVLVSLVTLARTGALLWAVRRGETTLMRGRGTSVRRLVATAALESAPLVAVGAAVGILVPGSSLVSCAVIAVVSLGVLVLTALLGARSAVTTVATRRTRVLSAGLGFVVLAAAGVALWQFLLYTNAPGANPFGALAPALGILSIAVVAVVVVPPAFRALEVIASRSPTLGRSLAVRHLARDAAVHSTSVLLIVLAVGGATLAAGYAGSATAAERLRFQSATGGDVRVHLDGRPSVDDTSGYVSVDDYGSVTGASSALAALATEARVGGTQLELVATSPTREATLPAGTTRLEVGVEAPVTTATLDFAAWLVDPQGQAVRVEGGRSPIVDIPPGSWSLLAIEVHVGGISGRTSVPVTITSIRAGATELLDSTRMLRLTVAFPTGRAMLDEAEIQPLPVVLSNAASSQLVAPPGATITLTLPAIGATVDAVVVATASAVDGSLGALALHTDLAALDEYLLRTDQRVPQPNEVWIGSPIPEVVADEVALLPALPAAITTRSSIAGTAAASTAVFLLGSAGAALLALVGVAAVASSLGRQREVDGSVLRALGLDNGAIGRIRLLELSLATLAATIIGVIAGLLGTALYVPVLARTSMLSVDGGAIAIAVVSVVGFLVSGAVVGGALTDRRSR